MTQNDFAWNNIFEKYHILDKIQEQGEFIISANQIKEFREPRLMTKFDHEINLPDIFKINNLAILPISRGDYIISRFSAYKTFEAPNFEMKRISAPDYIQSLSPQFLFSESIALNYAHASSILDDFLEDDELVSTVTGRMSSGNFDYYINTNTGKKNVSVLNSQIEIDAAYEGINYLSLFEAKRDMSDDFLIRQLYYPYRTWERKITKPIKTVFLIFSNGVFYLYQYEFKDPKDYNSLQLKKQKNYVISTEISLNDIENILQKTVEVQEPINIPFPQANSMPRLVNLIEWLSERPMSLQAITNKYAFEKRQSSYYTDAGRYLDLIEKTSNSNKEIIFKLSKQGEHIVKLRYRERQLAIISKILEHRVFNEVLKIHLKSGEMPDKNTIVSLMKQSNSCNMGDNTIERRSSTITGWINWILNIIEK